METVNGLISVITPAYNRELYIEECINSVLAQSYQKFEIIIVDDGSTDKTYEICRSLALNDDRIKLFAANHGGVSAARNRAIEESSGEFVFFLDSDDTIHPSVFETFIRAINEHNADLGGSECIRIHNKNWQKYHSALPKTEELGDTVYIDKNETIKAVFKGSGTPLNLIGGTIMRRSLIGETRFRTDLHIGEDFYFIYENLLKGASAFFLIQKWYYERIHNTNTSKDYSFEGFKTRFVRRELVWKSEESFGRTENAAKQKRNTIAIFFDFLGRHKPYSETAKKIRSYTKKHKKDLFSGLVPNEKLRYYLYTFFPFAVPAFLKTYKAYKKLKHRKS